MVNKASEGNNKKVEVKLKHYNDEEMIILLKEKEHYKMELENFRHQLKEAIVKNDHYRNRIKILEEENIKLQNENQRLQLENNELISQLKAIKKITEGY